MMTASEPVPSPAELLAPLVDMTDNSVSGDPCTLVFHFQRSDGAHLSLLHCVQLAVVHARFPKLPAEWADDVIAADRQIPGAIDREQDAKP